jgi:hypothetical protein
VHKKPRAILRCDPTNSCFHFWGIIVAIRYVGRISDSHRGQTVPEQSEKTNTINIVSIAANILGTAVAAIRIGKQIIAAAPGGPISALAHLQSVFIIGAIAAAFHGIL